VSLAAFPLSSLGEQTASAATMASAGTAVKKGYFIAIITL
jgi:hypothetical protein